MLNESLSTIANLTLFLFVMTGMMTMHPRLQANLIVVRVTIGSQKSRGSNLLETTA
jgi:hypothetical protein